MNLILAVGAGGAIGAVARYLLSSTVMRFAGGTFPYGTLAVNVLGCVMMGVVIGLVALRLSLPQSMQMFLTTGILGGFTTFSAFSLDAFYLFERQAYGAAAVYVLASVALSLAGLVAGLALARMVTA